MFEVVWDGNSYPNPANGCDFDDSCTLVGETCHCSTTTSMGAVFSGAIIVPSPEELLSQLHIGAPQPDTFDPGTYTLSSTEASGVEVWTKVGSAEFDMDTMFKVPNAFGGDKWLANKASQVNVGGFSFRNPPTHSNPYLPTSAEAGFEIDALLDHLTNHPNTPLFVSHRMILRFTSSNPSPRYLMAVADAFRTGTYGGVAYSGDYGDLGAMMAAILLDREARSDTVEMDPTHGKLREPLLKIIGLLRSMELESYGANPVMIANLQEVIGQDVFQTPSVFNFYDFDYSPTGVLGELGLYSPEAELLTPSDTISFLNKMMTTINDGMSKNCGTGTYGLAESTPGGYNVYTTAFIAHHVPAWEGGCSGQSIQYEGPGATSVGRRDGVLSFSPSDPSAGLDALDLLLTGGRLSNSNKAYVQEKYDAIMTPYFWDGPSHMTAMMPFFGAGLDHAESACELDSSPHELSCCGDTLPPPAPLTDGGSAMASCAAPGAGGCIESSCEAADALHEVSCCSDDPLPGYQSNAGCDVWAESRNLPNSNGAGGCVHAVDLATAMATCAGDGSRLCTLSELELGCAAATGCGHSAGDHIWTGDACVTGPAIPSFHDACQSWTASNGLAPVYGISHLPDAGCVHNSTHGEAVELCAAIGGRLCTEAEILGGCVYGTGCEHAWEHLHTSTECPEPLPIAISAAQRLIIGAPEYHTSSQNIHTEGLRTVLPSIPNLGRDYKAIVLLNIHGGYDSWNMLVPHSNCPLKDMYGEYASIRTTAAVGLGQLLAIEVPVDTQPCSTFGINNQLPTYKQLYDDGDMLFVANIGNLREPTTAATYLDGSAILPHALFSHTTQSRQAQNVHAQLLTAKGVLGRMAEALTMGDAPYALKVFSIAGNHKSVQGSIPAIQISSGGGMLQLNNFESNSPGIFNMSATESVGLFAETFAQHLEDTLATSNAMGAFLGSGGPAEQALIGSFGNGRLSRQMKQVAKIIIQRNHPVLDSERNLFVVEHRGGFDSHQGLDLSDQHAAMDGAISELANEMKAHDLWDNVTVIQMSEFGRTLTTNGMGTDHAWGGHNLIVGGAVDGGKILGTYPDDLEMGPTSLNIGRGRMVPSTPWEAVWYGLSQWMDVADEHLEVVLPNVNNWQVGNTLFTKGQIFSGFELGFDPDTNWTIAPPLDLVPPVLYEVKLLTDNSFGIDEDLVVDCTQRNYQNSVDYCESSGGSIASIHDEEANEVVLGQLQTLSCHAYIGAESDGAGNWVWNDGSAWEYVNPSNDLIGVAETRIAFLDSGQWHDWGTGSHKHGVVCSIAPYQLSGYVTAAGADVATTGDTVILILHASEQIETPTVIFQSAGMNTEDSGTCADTCMDTLCDAGVIWSCTYTVAESDYGGDVTFSVDYADTNNNGGNTTSTTTDDSSVSVDQTGPTVATATLTSSSENGANTAMAGDAVDLIVVFTETVTQFGVSLQSGGATVADAPDCSADDSFTVWTCVYTVTEADGAGDVSFSFIFADTSGNAGVASPTPEQSVTIINFNPSACPIGYGGSDCATDIDECAPVPCHNDGTCTEGVDGFIGSFTCACMPGWISAVCDINVDECASTPCANTGTCTDLIDEFTCVCNAGYAGSNCATETAPEPAPEPVSHVDCIGEWVPDGECSASCGGGTSPVNYSVLQEAVNGGLECSHVNGYSQLQSCGSSPCAVDCDGTWGPYSFCSATCGGGTRSREFTVFTYAVYGGVECEAGDSAVQESACEIASCPVDCEGSWGSFGDCSMDCGGGFSLQEYTIAVDAEFGGAECPALDGGLNSEECNTETCPPVGTVSTTLELSGDPNNLPPSFEADFAADMAALLGVAPSQIAVNNVGPPGPVVPIGRRLQEGGIVVDFSVEPDETGQALDPTTVTDVLSAPGVAVGGAESTAAVAEVAVQPPPQDCVGSWGAYGECSVECGDGSSTRFWAETVAQNYGGAACEQFDAEPDATPCVMPECPVDCIGDWGTFGACSTNCGGGWRTQSFVVATAANDAGAACGFADGATNEQPCSVAPCPVDCYGSWDGWSDCSASGHQFQEFTVTAFASNGGGDCEEYNGQVEFQNCEAPAPNPCPTGYGGSDCATDIDECAPAPCQNDGTCTQGTDSFIGSFTCACSSGWIGTVCEINVDECASTPCSNAGACADGVDQYTCACATGYAGSNCATDIDECASSPCANAGACTSQVDDGGTPVPDTYTCACAAGYAGSNCIDVSFDNTGCPFDSQGACADGSIGHCPNNLLNAADLLQLLSVFYSCSFANGCEEPSNVYPWVYDSEGVQSGYPIDGFPENGDGTWGDGVINVHDLLDLLGNYYRDYTVTPCV